MAIKDILVHVTDSANAGARMDAAVALAEAHGAHLTGLYTMWIPPIPGYVEAQIGTDLIEKQRQLYVQRAGDAKRAFSERADRAGLSSEWRCQEGHRAELLNVNAHYCDLLVMGRHEDDAPGLGVDLVEAVVMDSGKPVLVLPDGGAPATGIGHHIMAGWNGAREAVRAIDAALPLMTKAQRVDVIAVDPKTGPHQPHGAVPGADLAAHLARHGVRVDAQAMQSDGHGVGEALLARATADGADLLVMGAYGHSRWREVVLGGATAYVLRHSKLPVLMAH